nr:hypothetical protein [uncultured Cohaesibacter sp.]
MKTVALELCGEPNKYLSQNGELRFGSHGSLSVQIAGESSGSYLIHETGEGGGVIDLVMDKLGCSQKKAGIWINQKYGDNDERAETHQSKEEINSYCDEEGNLLYQAIRYYKNSEKKFFQRRPDSQGGWTKA